MSVSNKVNNTQVFRMLVYRRPLHPELFEMNSRAIYRHGDYEAEGWVIPYGHVMRFQVGNDVVTEALVENGDHLPESGLFYALPCIGEKDYEMGNPDGSRVGYVTSLQTETLTDNLYQSTYREMREFALESGSQFHEWMDSDGQACMSVMDTQKYRKEFHVQSYHLLGTNGTVLRTQSIFEVC